MVDGQIEIGAKECAEDEGQTAAIEYRGRAADLLD